MEQRRPAQIFASLVGERNRLELLLRGRPEARLAERPPNGKWSVVENVRHLLFAEQAHLGRLLPQGRRVSSLGLPQGSLWTRPEFRALVEDRERPLDAILAEWESFQQSVLATVEAAGPENGVWLERLLRHQQAHILTIERLLRALDREAR